MVMASKEEKANYDISTYRYDGKKDGKLVFRVWLHYDFSNCGLWNAHFPETYAKDGWEELYKFLYAGDVPEDDDYEFPTHVAIFRFSGTGYGDVEEFYQWCELNHPGVMTRDVFVTNPNSGNQIACYNFYTSYSQED